MAERSSLNQNIQIGVETVRGTPVAATKRLQALGIEPSVSVETSQFRPIGSKFNALSTLGKEWSESSLTGRGTYTEIIYPLSSVMTTGVVSTVNGASQWTFSPATRADDNPKTFTVEHGSGVRADRFSYGIVTEFGMSFSRDEIGLTGSMMGRAIEDGITMTSGGGVTAVPLVPILPTQVSVYMDDEFADLGNTKMTRMISGEFSLGSRFGPVWVLDAANPSFVNHVETEPDLSCTLLMQADTQGMGLLQSLREGETKFLRIEAIGGDIGATTEPYRFTLDLAMKVSDTGGFSDADGVYAIEFSGVGVHDDAWDKAVEINVVNELATL